MPGKNLRKLAGKSLVRRAIEAGLGAKLVNRVILSTDSEDIASEGVGAGAEVPFLRPSHLASDDATSADAAIHALDAIRFSDGVLVLLQPTSPLRYATDVDAVLRFKAENGLPCVVTCGPDGKPNGAIYAIDVALFLAERSFYPADRIWYYEMSAARSIDVDTEEDFLRAEESLAAPLNWDG